MDPIPFGGVIGEMEPESPDVEEKGGGWMGDGVLTRGLQLGKMAAIAGAAIAGVPVVVPPLLLLSALGLAVSVPFGAFLACVAGADKLMTTLLPLPPDQEEEQEDEEKQLEVAEEEQDEDEEKQQEVTEEEEVVAMVVEEKKEEMVMVVVVVEEQEQEQEGGKEGESAFEIEVLSVSSDYKSAAEEQQSDVPDDESRLSVERSSDITVHSTTVAEAEVTTERKPTVSFDDEGVYSKENIWDQIIVMRNIVGYRAAPHLTCAEELRALFIFTGVEPPESLTDLSDLMEVNAMLQSLKSLVGVK